MVRRTARQVRAFGSRRERLLAAFNSLPVDELEQHLHVHPRLHQIQLLTPSSLDMMTLSIGLPELLSKLFPQYGSEPRSEIPRIDASFAGDATDTLLFGSPSRLISRHHVTDSALLLCVLIVRPGNRDLLLDGAIIQHPFDPAKGSFSRETTRWTEHLIRTWHTQWFLERDLWNQPAEEVLPEVRSPYVRDG
jgi:hypothetical protein